MFVSTHCEMDSKNLNSQKVSYSVLREISMSCKLTKSDRHALADHIIDADRIGTGVYALLARLLSMKLLYASVAATDEVLSPFSANGSFVTFAIDGFEPQSEYLFQNEKSCSDYSGIHVASLLGATLIGLRSGVVTKFLQPDGSFRNIHLIKVRKSVSG